MTWATTSRMTTPTRAKDQRVQLRRWWLHRQSKCSNESFGIPDPHAIIFPINVSGEYEIWRALLRYGEKSYSLIIDFYKQEHSISGLYLCALWHCAFGWRFFNPETKAWLNETVGTASTTSHLLFEPGSLFMLGRSAFGFDAIPHLFVKSYIGF